MPIKIPVASSLKGTTVALPESRQLDVLAALFERRGSTVIRIPLVTILDSSDRQAVESWLREFIADPPDYLIILTGEGIRRLAGFARRAGCLEGFTQVLSVTIKVCRGPKPGRALKELGLDPDLQGKQPTTAGIIATLDALQLRDARVGVQLYGEDPNVQLIDYLTARQASISTVAPYVYAAESDTQRVTQLIGQLLAGEIDLIAFTSKPQFGRLLSVARTAGQEPELLRGLAQTLVAAVGPVVAAQLAGQGVRVDITPRGSYFMKPMVREIERYLARES